MRSLLMLLAIGLLVSCDQGDVNVVASGEVDQSQKKGAAVLAKAPAVEAVGYDVDWREKAGMEAYTYLETDGGPHLLLPGLLGEKWGGRVSSGRRKYENDFDRAVEVTKSDRMSVLRVGAGVGVVLRDPSMTAWGYSPEGWVDVYRVGSWETELDGLIDRAVASVASDEMRDTGRGLMVSGEGLVLMYAGSQLDGAERNVKRIPLEPGRYRLLEGRFTGSGSEDVTIYRLTPVVELAKLANL